MEAFDDVSASDFSLEVVKIDEMGQFEEIVSAEKSISKCKAVRHSQSME